MRLVTLLLVASLGPTAAHASMCFPEKAQRIVTPADGARDVPRAVEARVFLVGPWPNAAKLLREDHRLVDARGVEVPLAAAQVEASVLSMKPAGPLAADAEYAIEVRDAGRWMSLARFRTGAVITVPKPPHLRLHRAELFTRDVPRDDKFVPPAARGKRLRSLSLTLEVTPKLGPLDALALEVEGRGVVAVADASRLGRLVPVRRGDEGLDLTSIGVGPSACRPHDPETFDASPVKVRAVWWSATGERVPSVTWADAPYATAGPNAEL